MFILHNVMMKKMITMSMILTATVVTIINTINDAEMAKISK